MLMFLKNRFHLFLVALILLLCEVNYALAQTKTVNHDPRFKTVPEVEKAIDEGLIWLLYQQSADGSWRADETIDPITKQARPRLGSQWINGFSSY